MDARDEGPVGPPGEPAPVTPARTAQERRPPSRSIPGGTTEARRRLGQVGEAAVADWYVANGYEILARNWRCREGEIDLIVVRSRVVVFCEVKSRSSEAFGAPVEAVTRDKQRRIRRLAARWLHGDTAIRPRSIRFDVAGVLRGEVEILEGAF